MSEGANRSGMMRPMITTGSHARTLARLLCCGALAFALGACDKQDAPSEAKTPAPAKTDTKSNDKVAATVNPECDNWHDVKGLQISGKVEIVEGVERAKALAIYLKKFPQIDALYAKPQGEHEETIAKRLKAANFYKVVPAIIRVIDNNRGFGWREEFIPGR